jgi:DNA repair exonuclease SbcCD nuclease subunit
MFTVHCISDLHLDAVTHGVPRRDEILRSVHASLELIREGDVLVVNGDITDPGTNRSYQAIADAIEIDRRAKALGAYAVEWVVGNHDVLEDGSGGSVLDPLAAAGCSVHSEPTNVEVVEGGPLFLFLPHAPLARRYDPEKVVEELLPERGPVIVFGHLNPPGITPGSEVDVMPRGRDVMWPKFEARREVLLVGGHIHRAQEYPQRPPGQFRPWDSIQIVGSPVRFGFGEADHNPQTFTARWDGKDWAVERRSIESLGAKLARFVNPKVGDAVPERGDFARAVPDDEGEIEAYVKKQGATFVPLPKLGTARAKASTLPEAKKHRRVRDVVLDLSRGYPSAEEGLVDRVEETLERNGI